MKSLNQKITRYFVSLFSTLPPLKRFMWKYWYDKLAREIPTDRWTFMNYGYAVSDGTDLKLNPEDELDRFCINLYEKVIGPCDIVGKEVLEISSGRGGGASYLSRYHNPRKYTGVDVSPEAVALSKNVHKSVTNLKFAVGDAEHIPFPDCSFDVVLNVESSHCYGNMQKFLNEVGRVLRSGGYFLFADLRGATEMGQLKALLVSQADIELIEEEDITENVLMAMRADNDRKEAMIGQFVPAKMSDNFREFAGISGGEIQNALQDGKLKYFRFALRRRM